MKFCEAVLANNFRRVDLIFQLVKSAAEDSHGKDDIQALVESVEQKLANRYGSFVSYEQSPV